MMEAFGTTTFRQFVSTPPIRFIFVVVVATWLVSKYLERKDSPK